MADNNDNPFEDPYEKEQEERFQPADLFGKNYQTALTDPSTQQRQQSSAAVIQPNVPLEFENFNLQHDSTPAFTNPNVPLTSAPAPEPSNEANFSDGAFNEQQNQPPKEYHFWNVEYYSFLFNVDTVEVLHRVGRSLIPYPPRFFEIIQKNPDLYGPFWIASTVVFLLAATSNVANYFSSVIQDNSDRWEYDVNKLSYAAAAIYGYLALMPLILFGICKWWKINIRLIDFLCLYGYSFFIYVPVSVLCIIPNETLRWIVVGVGGIVSTLFLVLNTRPLLKDQMGKGVILLGIMAVLHLGFALSCQLYFFAH